MSNFHSRQSEITSDLGITWRGYQLKTSLASKTKTCRVKVTNGRRSGDDPRSETERIDGINVCK